MNDLKRAAMPPIRSYEVTVNGFDPVVYHRRTPAQARMAAWHDYMHCDDRCTFKKWLTISRVRRVPSPPPVGERVMICGKPADLISLSTRGDPLYMYADGNVVFRAHYSEIERSPAQGD